MLKAFYPPDLLCSPTGRFSEDPRRFSPCLSAFSLFRYCRDTPRLPELEGIMWAQAAPDFLGPVHQDRWGTLPPLHCQSAPGFTGSLLFLGTI